MTEPKSNPSQIVGSKNNYYKYLHEQEPGKYPARMGSPWKGEEIVKLLTAVRNKKTISEIATEHERTEGSIASKLRTLAGDYYFNDKRPIEEIQKFTGLSEEVILEVIKKRDNQEKIKESIKKTVLKQEEVKKNENVEIMAMLKDINKKLDLLLQIS